MNRIDETFLRLKQEGKAALVGFVSAGDPDFDTSLAVIMDMCAAGLDVLELGIPFSDPTADGPVIQRASQRALSAGMNPEKALQMTARIRADFPRLPIVLFGYYNPILAYGNAAFYRDARSAGADGLLVVDLPPEESDEMTGAWGGNALSLIRLIAPTTPPRRTERIVESAGGFLYLISKTGVTGSDGLNTEALAHRAAELKELSDLPLCIGFGVSTFEQAAAVAKIADGVVIGSAFERLIEENLGSETLPARLADRVKTYKAAIRGAKSLE